MGFLHPRTEHNYIIIYINTIVRLRHHDLLNYRTDLLKTDYLDRL
jgi:hypothetical protein